MHIYTHTCTHTHARTIGVLGTNCFLVAENPPNKNNFLSTLLFLRAKTSNKLRVTVFKHWLHCLHTHAYTHYAPKCQSYLFCIYDSIGSTRIIRVTVVWLTDARQGFLCQKSNDRNDSPWHIASRYIHSRRTLEMFVKLKISTTKHTKIPGGV